jgi:hypothetical protein
VIHTDAPLFGFVLFLDVFQFLGLLLQLTYLVIELLGDAFKVLFKFFGFLVARVVLARPLVALLCEVCDLCSMLNSY